MAGRSSFQLTMPPNICAIAFLTSDPPEAAA